MERKKYGYYIAACAFLLIIYAVGYTGLSAPEHQHTFAKLTPVNLLVSAVVVFMFHKPYNKSTWLAMAAIAVAGFLIELVGVKSGVIFGEYRYGGSLGLKLWDVPLIIGLNWLLLVYCSLQCAFLAFPQRRFLPALTAALLMTGLDVLLEPFAIRFGLWEWELASVPFRNYAAWFLFSFVLCYLSSPFLEGKVVNPVAIFLFLLQALFFSGFMPF